MDNSEKQSAPGKIRAAIPFPPEDDAKSYGGRALHGVSREFTMISDSAGQEDRPNMS